jgi:hypothetical protein
MEEAVKAFRLLPRETVADPALLEHMAREGVAERGGGWVYRFDPTANAARKPVDAWTLLDRIQAPGAIPGPPRGGELTATTRERCGRRSHPARGAGG